MADFGMSPYGRVRRDSRRPSLGQATRSWAEIAACRPSTICGSSCAIWPVPIVDIRSVCQHRFGNDYAGQNGRIGALSKAKVIARVWKQTKFSFIFVEVVAAEIVLSALADCVFHLGWGYDWMAVIVGLGIMAWGVVVYVVSRVIFRWTTSIYK